MTGHESEARLRAVLSKTTKQDTTGIGVDEDLIERLGLDSLQGLRVLAALEKSFAVRFPDGRLGELRTIRSLVAAIREARKEPAS